MSTLPLMIQKTISAEQYRKTLLHALWPEKFWPDREDFLYCLHTFLEQTPKGNQLPYVVALLEDIAPQFDDDIELIAQALQYPHYRVRVAAARALRNMGSLLEVVEPQLLNALNDPCISVVYALVDLLEANKALLSDQLSCTMGALALIEVSKEEVTHYADLEYLLWWHLTPHLNGYGEETIIFDFRWRSVQERAMSTEQNILCFLQSHSVPVDSHYFEPIDKCFFFDYFAKLLMLTHFDHPLLNNSMSLAQQLISWFDEDMVLLANVHKHEDGSYEHTPITFQCVDQAIICLDSKRIGLFLIADED